MMYTNVWFVADCTVNIGKTRILVRMLGRDFVLFRDEDGRVTCLSKFRPRAGFSARGRIDG